MLVDHALVRALPDTVRSRDLDDWVNWPRNIRQPIDAYFDIANESRAPSLSGYRKTARAIQTLLRLAVNRGRAVRPFGGGWSFSDIAVVPDWMVDTSYLNWIFHVKPEDRTYMYATDGQELFLVQCGTKISQVNRVIERKFRRSFNTTGASNGQSIVGACATGTHGSALGQGGIQNHVVGIHVITGPHNSVWLERASDPATVDDFAARLGADLVRDDAVFNAVLVSLGGMGFIASMMIKTVPIFMLERHRDWLPFDDAFKTVLDTLDFTGVDLPGQTMGQQPYFFLPVINPFDTDEVSVAVQYRRDFDPAHPINYRLDLRRGPGYELLGAIGGLTNAVPGTTPKLVTALTRKQLRPQPELGKSPKTGTWGEMFDFTTPRTNSLGAGIGVALGQVYRTLELLIDEQRSGTPAPVVFACRYVWPTGATLEFTRFDPTCVIDIDGVATRYTDAFLTRAWARLDREGIDYTQHWGKIGNYDPVTVRRQYGDARVDAWRVTRAALLDTSEKKALFASTFLERAGLA